MTRNPIARSLSNPKNRQRVLPDKRFGVDQEEAKRRLQNMQRELDDAGNSTEAI